MFLRGVVRRKIPGALLSTLLVLQFTLLTVLPVSASGSADFSFANGAFRKIWERPDLPVEAAQASRSHTWGPEGWAFLNEPYAESPDGKRLVQYFDKTRMEITNPTGDQNGDYYVTNGLLVREMVSGQIQEGDNKFRPVAASVVPVAGDPSNNPGPTYQSFKGKATLTGNNKVLPIKGEVVKATLTREGVEGQNDDLGKYAVKYAEYNSELGHNIPDVFWNFMTKQGIVYQNGKFVTAQVINWTSTMGFPLTEAYWSKVVVGGKEKDVLIQLYERRVLTYTPDNEEAYKVEMGNVGAHYYAWRYPGKERVAPYAVVNVNNDTDCSPLTLALTGQDNLTIEIPLKNTKPYKLGPGKYDYKATGCGRTLLEGSKTFESDSQYDWKFYFR